MRRANMSTTRRQGFRRNDGIGNQQVSSMTMPAVSTTDMSISSSSSSMKVFPRSVHSPFNGSQFVRNVVDHAINGTFDRVGDAGADFLKDVVRYFRIARRTCHPWIEPLAPRWFPRRHEHHRERQHFNGQERCKYCHGKSISPRSAAASNSSSTMAHASLTTATRSVSSSPNVRTEARATWKVGVLPR